MPSSLNGTGVTFNDGSTLQSGNIPAANLGSGTANSTTFLRGDRTFATPPSVAPTTAQVLTAYAGATFGAVGTYAFVRTRAFPTFISSAPNVIENTTVAGSRLTPAGIEPSTTSDIPVDGVSSTLTATRGSSTLSGTWRFMNRSIGGASYRDRLALCLRIS